MTLALRTFIAVDLPASARSSVAELQAAARARGLAVRWVPAANLHLTVKFLGAVEATRLGVIQSAAAAALAAYPPLALHLEGLGVFPDRRRPRILWVGVGGQTDRLEALQQGLEKALAEVGLAAEPRPFKSHLTIARFKRPEAPGRVAAVLEDFGGFRFPPFDVTALELFESRLGPEGPSYQRLARFPLTGAPHTDPARRAPGSGPRPPG
jgi:2'-5' RNA ligase